VPFALLVLAAAGWCSPAHGDTQNDLLLFPSVLEYQRFDSDEPGMDGSDPGAALDTLYTFNSDHVRVLGEFLWSDTEHELERLQVAWQFDDRTILWFGRFHSIANFWTNEFHHGQFLQTSISRPGLDAWEDESGPLPSHLIGALFERAFAVKGAAELKLAVAAGLGPKLVDDELVPLDLLDPESGHKLDFNVSLTYRPNLLTANELGVVFSRNDIAVESDSSPQLAGLDHIDQNSVGVFANWYWQDWRIIANWMYFDMQLVFADRQSSDNFAAAYAQGEYSVNDDWTAYGRIETGIGEDDSSYLWLLPAFIAHRSLAGIRWDFTDKQSLTLEAANVKTQGSAEGHAAHKELWVQWSAVFP
jgi:hypothetical protein